MSAPLQTNREIKKSPVAQPETPSLTMAVHFHKDQDNPKLLKSYRDEERRYSVKWPWRTQIPNLSDNFGLCLGRLKSLIRRVRENTDLLKEYDKVFKNQSERGIIEVAGKIDGMMTHRFDTFRVQSDIIFQGLTTRQSHSRYAVLAEYVSHQGLCHGAAYSVQYGDWQNVIVQANHQITLTKYDSDSSTTESQIRL
ncbi:unnamed protein product [Enterobius vermicularis]|uniref:Protein kinase domain-containing protein n=1 Tax=Enterobius vermicularis TaxID=51028 RepID=A0A0N4VHP6_ENTVE|nr:unnamed protein product [Enterobius vermicularis]